MTNLSRCQRAMTQQPSRVKRVALGCAIAFMSMMGQAALAEPVQRVKDGDSFILQSGREIRLYGIDAPELRQECTGSNGRTWRCGTLAADRLKALVDGRDVQCQPRDTDRYQRTVAVCRVGRTDLGRELVRAGLAEAYRRYSTDYVADEEEARRNGLGIWAGRHTQPERHRHPR